MNILKNPLQSIEYFTDDCTALKNQIVLHHTVSSKGKGVYVKDGFANDKGKSKIAVSYVIDSDGVIYELFDPKYWGYHLGIPKIDNVSLCKKSIAIELVNEGGLQKKGNDYYWFDGKYKYSGDVLEYKWRDYSYYAKYTDIQLLATVELVKYLCDKFKIIKDVVTDFNYDAKYINHKGIIMHNNVRTDKTDLSPAFDINKFKTLIG